MSVSPAATRHALALAVSSLVATSANAQVRPLFTGVAGLATSNAPGTSGSVFSPSASAQATF